MSENLLYCPQCRSEYREGFSICSECNVPLVRRLDSETEEGAGDRLVPLAREHSFEFVTNLLDRLEKGEVPYVVEAGTALALLDGGAAETVRPEDWEARVWVAQSAETTATQILEELNSERQSERWEKRSSDIEEG